jgi:hypothetical protein
MNKIWHGEIKGGKLLLDEREKFGEFLGTRADGRYELILRPKPDVEKEESKANQYRYLFGVVYDVACNPYTGCGYYKEELHEEMKKMFNPVQKPDLVTGEMKIIGGTTQNMTVKERSEFIDKVRRKLAEMGYPTPDAREVDY